MHRLFLFFILLICTCCNSQQREHENALLFPKKQKYGFEVTYNTSYYADVTICFNFSDMPSDKTIAAIETELAKFEERYQNKLVHETKKANERYSVLVNFKRKEYDTYLEYDMENGVGVFGGLLKSIDDNPDIHDLLAVHFE